MIQPIWRTQQMTRAAGNNCISAGSLVHHARLVSNTSFSEMDRRRNNSRTALFSTARRCASSMNSAVSLRPAHRGLQRHASEPTGLVMPAWKPRILPQDRGQATCLPERGRPGMKWIAVVHTDPIARTPPTAQDSRATCRAEKRSAFHRTAAECATLFRPTCQPIVDQTVLRTISCW